MYIYMLITLIIFFKYSDHFHVLGIEGEVVNGTWSWQYENIKITYIEAFSIGNGEFFTEVRGGIGEDYVTLHFTAIEEAEDMYLEIFVYAQDVYINDFTIGKLNLNSTVLYE